MVDGRRRELPTSALRMLSGAPLTRAPSVRSRRLTQDFRVGRNQHND
jgi:hypothetical protein